MKIRAGAEGNQEQNDDEEKYPSQDKNYGQRVILTLYLCIKIIDDQAKTHKRVYHKTWTNVFISELSSVIVPYECFHVLINIHVS